VPVDDHAARFGGELGRGEAPVDDAQLMLVVADAELDITGPAPGGFAGEVRLGTQQLGVPARRRRQVLGPEFMVLIPRSMATSFPHPRSGSPKIATSD
jgi:hypothetical protein